jgi:hypothetical protein
VAADFDCGKEPEAPPQDTTKEVVEVYIVDTLAYARVCKSTLAARYADAARYNLIKKAKSK